MLASAATQSQPVKVTGHFYLQLSKDTFGIRSHGVIEKTGAHAEFYPLPQSDVEFYKRLRSEDLEYMAPYRLTAREYRRQEVIGPYQIEGGRLWFGLWNPS